MAEVPPKQDSNRFESRSFQEVELPPKPLTPAQSRRRSMENENAFLVHLQPDSVKIFGSKWVDPPMLERGKVSQWKNDMEGFVRRLTSDGHMVNVMFGCQAYHRKSDQENASKVG